MERSPSAPFPSVIASYSKRKRDVVPAALCAFVVKHSKRHRSFVWLMTTLKNRNVTSTGVSDIVIVASIAVVYQHKIYACSFFKSNTFLWIYTLFTLLHVRVDLISKIIHKLVITVQNFTKWFRWKHLRFCSVWYVILLQLALPDVLS